MAINGVRPVRRTGRRFQLDLIDAAADRGIEFVLCRTETAGAIMAAVTGELSGIPGVVLTGIGPGAASVVNGIAYASLERAPVVVFTDAHDETPPRPHRFSTNRLCLDRSPKRKNDYPRQMAQHLLNAYSSLPLQNRRARCISTFPRVMPAQTARHHHPGIGPPHLTRKPRHSNTRRNCWNRRDAPFLSLDCSAATTSAQAP